MEAIRNGWCASLRLGRKFGPYLLIEALMPGGTLIALLLYLYRSGIPCSRSHLPR